MFLIRAYCASENDAGIATYDVSVFINAREIWRGRVGEHKRADGWTVLAGHIAHAAGMQSAEERKDIEQGLQAALQAVRDGGVHCPACGQALTKSRVKR